MTKRAKLRLGIILAAIIVMGSAIWWAQTRNMATVTHNADPMQATSTGGKNLLSDDRFNLTYSSDYRLLSKAQQPPDLADYMLAADTSYDKRMSVMLTQGNLSTTSAYLFRKTRTDLYTNRMISVASGTASVWTKQDGSEVTAFLEHNGMVATISYSIQNSNVTAGLSSEMSATLASFRWQ